MSFLAGYILGIGTALAYLLGEAFYEASRVKRRAAHLESSQNQGNE